VSNGRADYTLGGRALVIGIFYGRALVIGILLLFGFDSCSWNIATWESDWAHE